MVCKNQQTIEDGHEFTSKTKAWLIKETQRLATSHVKPNTTRGNSSHNHSIEALTLRYRLLSPVASGMSTAVVNIAFPLLGISIGHVRPVWRSRVGRGHGRVWVAERRKTTRRYDDRGALVGERHGPERMETRSPVSRRVGGLVKQLPHRTKSRFDE